MKNVNHNLINLLHSRLDDIWRIEKHYMNDSKGVCKDCDPKDFCPNCEKLLAELKKSLNKEVDMLKVELKNHMDAAGGKME